MYCMQSVSITTDVSKSVRIPLRRGVLELIQYYVIMLFIDLQQVGGFLRVFGFHPPIKLIATIYMYMYHVAEILLKMVLNTLTSQSHTHIHYDVFSVHQVFTLTHLPKARDK